MSRDIKTTSWFSRDSDHCKKKKRLSPAVRYYDSGITWIGIAPTDSLSTGTSIAGQSTSFTVKVNAVTKSALVTVASDDARVCSMVLPAFFSEKAGLSRWTKQSFVESSVDGATNPVCACHLSPVAWVESVNAEWIVANTPSILDSADCSSNGRHMS
jgi:hypothetical protein